MVELKSNGVNLGAKQVQACGCVLTTVKVASLTPSKIDIYRVLPGLRQHEDGVQRLAEVPDRESARRNQSAWKGVSSRVLYRRLVPRL